ncbi:Aquaporin-1 [Diatrype stigma]|uniref:Aquaporin-1 n=1 Tax=Diatrype stigma TaxID=117547 RepID=A0AAN9V2Z2_9PEZI
METQQVGNRIRLPWEKPNAPATPRRPGVGSRQVSMAQSLRAQRIRFLNFLPLAAKNRYVEFRLAPSDLVAVLSEFSGTFMFLLFAFGGTNTVNSAPQLEGASPSLASNPSKLMFISLCFGLSLAVNAWTFFRISGGLFNPAVSIGMMVVGARIEVTYVRGILIIIAQLLGAIAASAVVYGLQPGGFNVATTLGGPTTVAQGLFIEMFLTMQLVFTIFMLAAEKHKGTFMAPLGIGLSLFIAELMGVYYTGGSLNPARSFGPCVVNGHFPGYHWIYWLGPILGALVASGFYVLIKALEYETVNPEQDHETAAEKRGQGHNKDGPGAPIGAGAGPHTGGPKHNGATHNGSGAPQGLTHKGERTAYSGGPELEAGRGT